MPAMATTQAQILLDCSDRATGTDRTGEARPAGGSGWAAVPASWTEVDLDLLETLAVAVGRL